MLLLFADINRHPVSTCDLHRIIDNRFSSSSFTKHVCCKFCRTLTRLTLVIFRRMRKAKKVVFAAVNPLAMTLNIAYSGRFLAVRRSPRKAEKKPVYVLNFTIPPRLIDNCLEPTKASVQFQVTFGVTYFFQVLTRTF
jgi:DNA mismatch repair protein MLH3